MPTKDKEEKSLKEAIYYLARKEENNTATPEDSEKLKSLRKQKQERKAIREQTKKKKAKKEKKKRKRAPSTSASSDNDDEPQAASAAAKPEENLALAIIQDPMQNPALAMAAALQQMEARVEEDPLLAEAIRIEEEKRAEFDRAFKQVKKCSEWQKKVDSDYKAAKSSSARITSASLRRKAQAMDEAKFSPIKKEAARQLEAAQVRRIEAIDAYNEAAKDRKELEFRAG